MEPTETLTSAIEQLRESIDGDAFVPGDADWDQSRLAWNLAPTRTRPRSSFASPPTTPSRQSTSLATTV